ncbi:hypothetical protein HDU97_002820 [Phlyctochytrium planicorne]|nr:hypothetical protein HDU97_002820 [Phlyctochytrium planicorne]
MPHNDVPVNLPAVFPQGEKRILNIPNTNSFVAYEDSHPDLDDRTRPVVYCVPGIGDFRHSYRFLAPRLADAGYRVIVQDLRGVGESGTKFDSFTIEDVASDIINVLDAEKIKTPVTILSNSLSAASAVSVASDHPDRVKAIVTFGGFFRDMPNDAYFRPATYVLFNHFWGQPMWTSFFSTLFITRPNDIDEYIAAVKAKMLSNCDHAGIIGQMCRASKNTAWSKIGNVKVPVFLVMGEKDPDFKDPKAETGFVAGELKGSRKVETLMVEEAGHYPHVEQCPIVSERVLEFLESV